MLLPFPYLALRPRERDSACSALTANSTYFGMTGKKPRSYRVIVFRAMPIFSASSLCVRSRRSLCFRSSRPVNQRSGYLGEHTRSSGTRIRQR